MQHIKQVLNFVFSQLRTVVARNTGTGKNAAHEVFRKRYLHGPPQKANLRISRNTATARENLKVNTVAFQANDLRERSAEARFNLRQLAVAMNLYTLDYEDLTMPFLIRVCGRNSDVTSIVPGKL